MRRRAIGPSLLTLASIAVPCPAAEPVPGLKVPPGFTVTEYAGPALANDIYTLHVDARGRVVVAGRGYVREIVDSDGDGRADRAIELVAGLKDGPMGLLWEGGDLYLVADGGLKRYRGVDGMKPAMNPETVLAVRTAGEHDAHAVRRGPDGALYLMCGNMAGVTPKTVTGTRSPITDPTAGVLLRIEGESVAVIADGFRNAYDFDFSTRGEPFTFDSDNERCVGLPWYEPTRFYRVLPGGHYGWLNPQVAQTWRRPPYFPDIVAPVATLGRGSPTGVACYRHTHFPEKYRGGFFLADWTFGKIWFVNPDAKSITPEPFLEATGENGFAPTGLAVHSRTGELFASVGGRGTRGAVYRIRYDKGEPNPRPIPIKPDARVYQRKQLTAELQVPITLDSVRAWQVRLGDLVAPSAVGTVWEGYTFRRPEAAGAPARLADAMHRTFPSGNADLDREVSRTLAALQDADTDFTAKVAAKLTSASEPAEDVHYLIVLARLAGPRTPAVTRTTADALVRLDEKYKRRHLTRDRHWPLRLTEAASALLSKDARLAAAILGHPDFGRAEHAWLARLPGIDAVKAARRFVTTAGSNPEYRWSAGHVEFLTSLPEAEARPILERLWQRGGMEDALVPAFARRPVEADRARFITGLRSPNPGVVGAAAGALGSLAKTSDDAELVALVRALRTVGSDKATAPARDRVLAVLKRHTGQSFDPDPSTWETWVTREKPGLAKQLAASGYDAAAWSKRLAGVVWDRGDPLAGKAVFTKASCAACHDGNQALGPPLQGVTKRFSRNDLFTAILDPSRDVPPRYRPTRITTDDGKMFDGVVIYDAVDGVILQTGADTTVRVAGERIESRKQLTTSPMPAGLLDPLSDAEIVDLLAYLRSPGDKPDR